MKPLHFIQIILAALLIPAPSGAQTTALVSVDSTAAQASEACQFPAISADGWSHAFSSSDSGLVAGDTNGVWDVFVHDRATGQTARVSVDSAGVQGNDRSWIPALSADGRYVAFNSIATNLVPGDTNDILDVFVHDRQSGQTERVSVDSSGNQGNGGSYDATISADGRYVAFESTASNFVPGDSNDAVDVFVHDRSTGITTRVSVDSSGAQALDESRYASIAGDGQSVAFLSWADNLVLGDTNEGEDTFVHGLLTGLTTRVSLNSQGQQSNRPSMIFSWGTVISHDGRFVVFHSEATNLVSGDTNGVADIYLHDRVTGQTDRVSVGPGGSESNGFSNNPCVSGDGRYIAFHSGASNLVPGDTNDATDVFVHDHLLGQTARASVSSSGAQASGTSIFSSISSDGHQVTFQSSATNLVPGDTNGVLDVFVHDLTGCSPTVASFCTASTTSIAGCQAALTGSGTPSLSQPSSFALSSSDIPGANLGIVYFGVAGPAALPIGTQGGLLCVGPPNHRSNPKLSGGTAGACDGGLSFTLQELTGPNPGVVDVGSTVHAALWFRDPPSPDSFALSDGLWFHVCP